MEEPQIEPDALKTLIQGERRPVEDDKVEGSVNDTDDNQQLSRARAVRIGELWSIKK